MQFFILLNIHFIFSIICFICNFSIYESFSTQRITNFNKCIHNQQSYQSMNSILQKNSNTLTLLTMQSSNSFGQHGENFKYLPLFRADEDEYFPRIIPIAGVYPTLSIDEFFAPESSPSPDLGTWAYEFTDPNGSQIGTVALPGSKVIYDAIDPVVLITRNTDLQVQVVEEVEMLIVVDRGDVEIRSDNFYLISSPSNELLIRSINTKQIPSGFRVLGKIVLGTVPFTSAMLAKSTGWLEEE